jgi:hypothetical protein
MESPIEKSVNDLVASINGKDMMSGWHVLVAYHEDDLNRLLAARHAAFDKDAAVSEIKQFKRPYSGKNCH